MFNNIREQRKNFFTYILVGLAGLGMLFLGVPFFTHASKQQYALKVNDTEISTNTVKEKISLLQRQLPELDLAALEKLAISQLTAQLLIEQHALDSDYTFSKPALFNLIKSQFSDNDSYQKALQQMHTNATAYETAQQRQQTIQNYYQFLHNSSLEQHELFEQYLRASTQTRDYTFLRLPFDFASQSITITDADIKAYYQAHPEQYQTDTLVDLEYVILDAGTLANDKQISDVDIEAAQKEISKTNTKRSGRYIIFQDDSVANTSRQNIEQDKQSFDEIYQSVNAEKITGEAGELMLNAHGSGPSLAVDDALFALTAPGDTSELLTTEWGPMLVSLTTIEDADVPTREETIKTLRQQAGENEYFDRAARAFDAAAANQPFTQIVDIIGAKPQLLKQITRHDSSPDWLQNTEIQNQLFGEQPLAVEQIGNPVELNDKRSIFYRLTHRVAPQTKPLEAVKEHIRTDLLTEKADALLKKQSEELMEALSNGENLDSIIKQYQVKKEQLTGISLNSTGVDLSPEALSTLFNQKQRTVITTANNKDYIIAQLEAVHDGNLEDIPDEMRQALFNKLQTDTQMETLASFGQWLQQQAEVKIYENNLPSANP